MLIKDVLEAPHGRKNKIKEAQSLIIEKWAYRTGALKDRKQAFYNMCDLSINAWPKETADPEALKDYTTFIELEKEYVAINQALIDRVLKKEVF